MPETNEIKLYHHQDCKKLKFCEGDDENPCSCGLERVMLYIHRLEEENLELVKQQEIIKGLRETVKRLRLGDR
ncbi:MAG: hypothetical protein JRC86_05965 [Deltaproteobacteria bacterium]|nr:hypothetical protein [Deltaproteobacteria bacterium]